jgi:hypothetical protein
MIYFVVYGLSDYWAFQYFAWSLPFWFFLSPWLFVPGILVASAYIYSLYWTLCGNPWLLGQWDFIGHRYWPEPVIMFRNAAVLFFLLCACAFLLATLWNELSALVRKGVGPSRTAATTVNRR